MKIDADAGGTVDWDEFTNYMFLQRPDFDENDGENWRFFPPEIVKKSDVGCHHKGDIAHFCHVHQSDKYLTSGHDGTLRIWNAIDLRHVKTVTVSISLQRIKHIVNDPTWRMGDGECLFAVNTTDCDRVFGWIDRVLRNCSRSV